MEWCGRGMSIIFGRSLTVHKERKRFLSQTLMTQDHHCLFMEGQVHLFLLWMFLILLMVNNQTLQNLQLKGLASIADNINIASPTPPPCRYPKHVCRHLEWFHKLYLWRLGKGKCNEWHNGNSADIVSCYIVSCYSGNWCWLVSCLLV